MSGEGSPAPLSSSVVTRLLDTSTSADRIAPKIRQTVLIVDDSPVVVALLISTLGNEFDILAANDGREAMRIAVDRMPDLILLDTTMPDSDGFEVCKRLAVDERTKNIPILFLVTAGTVSDQQRALELGALDFVSKPIEPALAGSRIRNYLELKRYRDFLENLALIDGLTGIGNRRRLEDTLDREWRRGRRLRAPLSLAILDIDYFKLYNESYGHAAGDECLRRIARILLETVRRPADLAARYGAEEFAAILPQTSLDGAVSVMSRVVRGVSAMAIPHERSPFSHVTVSIGVATLPEESEDGVDILIKHAEERLKEAKNSGRNRVL